ncbi:MAG TPA: NADPH-dependent FMN reductase [Herpetosiphonaceae bacterium]
MNLPSGLHIVGIGGTLRPNSTSRIALELALQAARAAGASTELLDLNRIRLPFYEPDLSLEEHGPAAVEFVAAARRADAFILSTGGYHGTMAGVTKNALDFLEFMARDERPYLTGRIAGVLATAGGELAAVNAINGLVNAVHALRGTVAPLFVPLSRSWELFDAAGELGNAHLAARLEQLGTLVAQSAAALKAAAV